MAKIPQAILLAGFQFTKYLRNEGDSNPRYPFGVYTLSSSSVPLHSWLILNKLSIA